MLDTTKSIDKSQNKADLLSGLSYFYFLSLGTTFTFSIFCVAQKAFERLKVSQFEQLFSIKFVIQRLQNSNNSIKYTWEKELFEST